MVKTLDFKTFWDHYGLKRERIAAENAWDRLSAKDKRAAFNGIKRYREDCQRQGVAMKYAQGYLNHRRWEDEMDEPQQPHALKPVGNALGTEERGNQPTETHQSQPIEMDKW